MTYTPRDLEAEKERKNTMPVTVTLPYSYWGLVLENLEDVQYDEDDEDEEWAACAMEQSLDAIQKGLTVAYAAKTEADIRKEAFMRGEVDTP